MNNLTFVCCLAGVASSVVCACSGDDFEQRAPKVYFASDGFYEISLADSILLSPKVLYDYGTSYSWLQNGLEVSAQRDLLFVPSAMGDYAFSFQVSNSQGADSFDVKVSVLDKFSFDEFDNFEAPKSKVLALCPTAGSCAFVASQVAFANRVNEDTSSWAGFAFCNKTSAASSISNASVGVAQTPSSSANSYLAVNAVESFATIAWEGARSPVSIDVACDNFVSLISKFGLSSSDGRSLLPMGKGDFFDVEVCGLSASGNVVSSVRWSLIDCSSENPARYVRQNDWVTLPLASLGEVFGLQFNVLCSVEGYPLLFCVDNLRLQ